MTRAANAIQYSSLHNTIGGVSILAPAGEPAPRSIPQPACTGLFHRAASGVSACR